MTQQNQIDNKTAEKLNLIGLRIATLKSALEFLLYCFESEIYFDSPAELYYVGTILNEYVAKTKALYHDIENELNVYR